MPTSKGITWPRDLVSPVGVIENAAAALRQSGLWIHERTGPTRSPVVLAMLGNIERASTGLEAVLRMHERGLPSYQPATQGELHAWLVVEECLETIASATTMSRECELSLQRRAWMALPAGWDQWTAAQAEDWAMRTFSVAPPGQGHLFNGDGLRS